jgi:hypothetical protein
MDRLGSRILGLWDRLLRGMGNRFACVHRVSAQKTPFSSVGTSPHTKLLDFAHTVNLTISRPTNSLGSVKLSSLTFQPQALPNSEQSLGVSQTTTRTALRSAQE